MGVEGAVLGRGRGLRSGCGRGPVLGFGVGNRDARNFEEINEEGKYTYLGAAWSCGS